MKQLQTTISWKVIYCINSLLFLSMITYELNVVQSASFDCTKASNYVEKRICEDATPFTHGLSELDDNLSRAYQTILHRSNNPTTIKIDQRKWLETRDQCKNAECIKRAYEDRFKSLHALKKRPKIIIPSNGMSVESHLFPRESEKLKVVQDLLKTHDMRPSTSFYKIKEQPYCPGFLKDLLANNIEAVEPDILAETAFDPALKKWQACKENDVESSGGRDPKKIYEGISLLGLPPYRYYQIEIDGDKENGKEDLLYHETGAPYYNKNIQVGKTAYSWVDLSECTIQGGASMSNIYAHQKDPGNFFRFSFIAKHQGKYFVIAVYPNTKNPKISNYNLSMIELQQSSLPKQVCRWREPIVETRYKNSSN